MRRYRYHFRGETSTKGLRQAAGLFQGEHDFESFTVERVGGRLRIDRIRIRRDDPFVLADFEAERFARGLVRRIAGAMEAYARGEVTEADLRGTLRGHPNQTAPAPPEGLFLLDVDCGLAWPPASARIFEAIRARGRSTSLAHRFASDMARHLRGSGSSTP